MFDWVYHLLAKVGFNHPLHPAITHLPMGMVMGGGLFGLVALVLKKEEFEKTAHYCFTLALIFILPTMLLGYMDWQYKFDAEWGNVIFAKIILACVFAVLVATSVIIGRKKDMAMIVKMIFYALCVFNAIALGFLGGQLQYG